ncbi:MAG: 3D-(3,5/4)-trihydroxycyclohexane-1,2-dione acylhydrolase (decyclizing) [bacterium]
MSASRATERMTVAAAIVEFLKRQWIERDGERHRLVRAVAGIFGHGNVAGLGQALAERGGAELPFLQPKNEQGMVHTAIAYAKALNRLGAIACTTSVGPGATNMVTGAATATVNRLPVLLLPGDVFATRFPAPVLQQLEHRAHGDVSVNDCFRPVARFWDRITRPEQLLAALPEAMRVLASPVETGAVVVCLPEDVQTEAWDFPCGLFEERIWSVPRPRAPREAIDAAAACLRAAKRPFLIAGGGVRYSEATEALRAFADATGVPIGLTQAGKGALLDDHPCCLGGVGATGTLAANAVARDADVVLLAGTRLSDFTTASKTLFQAAGVRFVSVQIDPFDAAKLGALPLGGDARTVLEDLTAALAGWRVSPAFAADVAGRRAEWDAARQAILSPPREGRSHLVQAEVIRVVNDGMGPRSTMVHSAGGLPGDLHKLWRCRDPHDYHSEYGYSCMGYEIAGALGVKLARPERDVLAFVGDGSWLMLHSELVTSLQLDAKIVVVLVDNGGYQCIRSLQRSCGGRSFGNEFRRRTASGELDGPLLSIDYAAAARSLGAIGLSAATEGELVAALDVARSVTRSVVIHVKVDLGAPIPSYAWWDVPVAETSAEPSVNDARRRWEEARAHQRVG